MTAPVDVEQPAGWYLYRFFAPTSVRCAVEGCTLRHPLYIGKSNEPPRREREHARKKAWYRLSLLPGGGWMIDERTFVTDRAVRVAELDAIHDELPLANEDGNEGNEHRLLFNDQPVMPRKVARRVAKARSEVTRPRRVPQVKPSTRNHVLAVAGVWLLIAGLLWWLAAAAGVTAGPLQAGAGSGAMLGGLWAYVERDARKGSVRFWRACALLGVAAVAVFLVWPWIGPHWVAFLHRIDVQQAAVTR